MRVGRDDHFHLTYCTNIHPGETWEAVQANLEAYGPPLKAQLSPEEPFGLGLRLSDQAARELLTGDHLEVFREWLDANGLYVFTLNGFPYGGFHRQRVKDQVHAPDWRTPDRAGYTLRLADILAALLPEGAEGSISTSPISYKPWLKDEKARAAAFQQGSRHLAEVAAALVRLRERTGHYLHVDLEPEPDGLIEDTEETIRFFDEWLLPLGGAHLAEQIGRSQSEAERYLLEHIGVCYDTCHFALAYEEAGNVFARFNEAGIRVGKVQISAALKVPLPDAADKRKTLLEHLRPFEESTYLHQVVARYSDGRLHHYPDLPEALPHLAETEAREWRIHFHVPIFIDDYAPLRSTQAEITTALDVVRAQQDAPHLEIETYTWEVLPPALKMDLLPSIRREFEWVLNCFS